MRVLITRYPASEDRLIVRPLLCRRCALRLQPAEPQPYTWRACKQHEEPSWAARWGLPEHPAVVKLREIAVLEQGKTWRINVQPAQR